MATRMYFGNFDVLGTAYNPDPGFASRGTWGSSSNTQCYLAPTGHASIIAYAGFVRNLVTAAAAGTIVRCKAISPPLSAGVVWDTATFTMVSRHAQSVDANTFHMYYVGILSNTGALKFMTLLEKDAINHAISITAASMTNSMLAGKLVGTSVAGDRLFVEIGDDKDSAIASDLRMAFLYSKTSGDLSTVEGSTTVANLWLETSLNVTFDAEGTTYGSGGNNSLMTMGCGS